MNMEQQCDDIDSENPNSSKKSLSHCYLPHHKSHSTNMGANPGKVKAYAESVLKLQLQIEK
jgi:hypothetical protein